MNDYSKLTPKEVSALISEKIEDQPDNSTRFLIIGQQAVPQSGVDNCYDFAVN